MLLSICLESGSTLIYASTQGKIQGIDLRSMKPIWTFESPANHGSISSFTFDSQRSWILSGSYAGVFSLWDLRFQLCVKSWAHPSRSRIHKLSRASTGMSRLRSIAWAHSSGGVSSLVTASVGNKTSEVGLWDLEAGECREVWCVFGAANAGRSGLVGSGDPAEEMNTLYGNGLKVYITPDRQLDEF
jgi:phosphoinositide-3-kinase, regulatory subunit 4